MGIVRVEQALSTELATLYADGQFRLCVWDRDRFVALQTASSDAPGLTELPATTVNPGSPSEIPEPPLFPLLTKPQALKAIAQGLLSLTPSWLRPYLSRILKYLKSRLVPILINRAVRGARKHETIAMVSFPSEDAKEQRNAGTQASIFKPNDVLISVGLDWGLYSNSFYNLRTNEGVKVVTCCYDLIPILFPQYCISDVAHLFPSYLLDLAEGSDLILCISETTRRDLRNFIGDTGGRMPSTHVFSLGDNVPSGKELISSQITDIAQQPFILFVSTVERRKNHEVLYHAYHLLCQDGKRDILPKLVFVGMTGWGVTDLLKDIEMDPLTQGLIVQLDHVNDAELRHLYEQALFCVYPSLYEGWGLPVGEALALHKIVLSSDRGSLPEVGGDLVRYVDPYNARAWADEIGKMIVDSDLRIQMQAKILNNYVVRTWSDAALSVSKAIALIADI